MLRVGGSTSRPMRAWADRLVPSFGPAVAIALVPAAAFAIETQSTVGGGAVGAVALGVVGTGWHIRRRSPAQGSWLGARPPLAPTSAPSTSRASTGGRAPRWRVVTALGRVEARELVCSPWFGVGVGFQLWFFLAFGVLYAEEDHSLWAQTIQQLVVFTHPLVGMLVVASHAATTRARHDNTDEMFESCPAGPSTRTAALLSTAGVGAVAVAAFLGLFLAVLAVRGTDVSGPPGADAVPDLLGGVTLGVGGIVLGVAVGRWVSWRLAPVVAVVAVGAVTLRMAADGGGWTRMSQLSTLLSVRPEIFLHRAAWWHLAWLVGLTLVVAGVALAGVDRAAGRRGGLARHPAVVAGAVGVLVALVGGVMATGPMSAAAAERLAGRVAQPAAQQACVPVAGAVRVCGFPGYGELRDRIGAEVAPVAAALPPGSAPVTLRQAYTGSLQDLPPEVRRRLPNRLPELPPGEVALALDTVGDQVRATRFLVALTAMGLPVAPDPGDRPVVVAGQARGVVTLWLAARGLSPSSASELATATRRGTTGPGDGSVPATADAFDRGYAWPGACDTAPVVWSAQDLAAARALLAEPAGPITAVLHAGWDRWRDPETPTDDLLVAAGLPPVGPVDRFDSRDSSSC